LTAQSTVLNQALLPAAAAIFNLKSSSMPDYFAPVDRRACLRWMGAAAAAAACSSWPAAAETLPGPSGRLRDFLLMRGALDERLVIGTISGQYYSVIDEELTPLFGVLGATFTRWRRLPDGGLRCVSFEHACYTDLDSGQVIEDWRNPLNGAICKVPTHTSSATARRLLPDLSFRNEKALPAGMSLEAKVVSMQEEAGELVIVERVRSAVPRPAPARTYRYSELVTLRASLTSLRDPNAKRVPCSNAFTNVSGWRPWMQMGDQSGHLMAQGVGRYGAEFDSLPAAWLEATRRLKPDWLADPASRLDALFKG